MLLGPGLHTAGLAARLTTLLPFSPLTIDLVNLERRSQLAIWTLFRPHTRLFVPDPTHTGGVHR